MAKVWTRAIALLVRDGASDAGDQRRRAIARLETANLRGEAVRIVDVAAGTSAQTLKALRRVVLANPGRLVLISGLAGDVQGTLRLGDDAPDGMASAALAKALGLTAPDAPPLLLEHPEPKPAEG